MKNSLYFTLLLTVSLLFCACSREVPQDDSTLQTTAEQQMEMTAAATEEVMETISITIEVTRPVFYGTHNADYSAEEIWKYFEEVVLNTEYSSGTGNAQLVQKWMSPIHYRFFGTPTEEDLAVLDGLFAQLNQIPGFPGIHEAAEGETEQLRISFLEPDVFRDSYSSVVDGEDANGAVEFWYYTDTNEIHSARIGYRTDIDQSLRNSILVEEIVNALGISDTVLREDSITYQYSDFNTVLSDVDWILLNLLYHPEIQCGMDAEACAAVVQQLCG